MKKTVLFFAFATLTQLSAQAFGLSLDIKGDTCCRTVRDLPDSLQAKLQEDISNGRNCHKQLSVRERQVYELESAIEIEVIKRVSAEEKAGKLQEEKVIQERRKKRWRSAAVFEGVIIAVSIILLL